jgi:hypothetical protein
MPISIPNPNLKSVDQETHSFIVRIWNAADAKAKDSASWRGSIDEVGSGRRLYFYDLESIVRFIREQVAVNTGMPVPARMPTLASLKNRLRAFWEAIRLTK